MYILKYELMLILSCMADTEPKQIDTVEKMKQLSFEEAQSYVNKFVYQKKEVRQSKAVDIDRMEKCLEVVANGLENGRTFHEASTSLWTAAKLAPFNWEEQDEVTDENRIGLSTLKLISNHSETLTKRIQENKGPAYWASMLTSELLVRKVWLIDSTIKDRALDILEKSKEAIKKVIFTGSRSSGILLKHYHTYFPEVFSSWLDEVEEKMETNPNPELLETLNILSTPDTFMDTRKVVQKILQGKSFSFSEDESADIVRAWIASTEFDAIGDRVERNLNTMYELEKLESGSVKYLNNKFGINCFGRYPTEMLVEQYRSRDDKESPYGLIFYPHGDHNGAFYSDGKVLSDFFKQLQQIKRGDGTKYNVRIFECKNLFSLGRGVVSSFREYGKIHFAVIGGHGSKNGLWFGNSESVSKSDIIRGEGIHRSIDFFIPQPPIVLVACSAGMEGGIAEEISKLSGGEVQGASENTSLDKLSVKLNNDSLELKAEYTKGITATYRNGKI